MGIRNNKNFSLKSIRFLVALTAASLTHTLPAYDLPPINTPVQLQSNTEILKQISTAVSAIAESSKKALVFVSVSKTITGGPQIVDPFEFFFGPGPQRRPRELPKQEGLGSGFFIDLEKGYLLTNNHVIDGADKIELKLANGETYAGKVIGRDPNTDIAVVEVADNKFKREGLEALILGDSNSITEGSFVVALGAPFGLEASISFGVVSAIGRGNLQITKLGDFIQTDAAINPGNSGGPLIGVDGKVVGINTAIFSRSGAYNGIGFSVPSNLVRKIATSLINEGSVERGYIGVVFEPFKEEWAESLKIPKGTIGSIITKVVEGGPADRAGLEAGDVIVAINGANLKNSSELVNIIGFLKPNEKAKIDYYRSGSRKSTVVTIGRYPGSEQLASEQREDEKGSMNAGNPYGIVAEPVSARLQNMYKFESKQGLVITALEENSPAAQARLMQGDVILAVNGKKVLNSSELNKILNSEKKMVLLHVERQGTMFFVSLKREEKNG